MKRYQIIFLVIAGLILLLWVLGRITGALQLYSIPTGGMAPTIEPGSKIFTTNLKKEKRFDIIVYSRLANKYGEPDSNGNRNHFFSRLIAMGGDTLEIKTGYAYINGKFADDSTILKFTYTFSADYYQKIADLLNINLASTIPNSDFGILSSISCFAVLTFDQYEQVKTVTPFTRLVMTNAESYINKMYPGTNWSTDNFGPYIIPADHYFVMGDNRHNSQDSRYTGPIPVKDFKGVVIGKH